MNARCSFALLTLLLVVTSFAFVAARDVDFTLPPNQAKSALAQIQTSSSSFRFVALGDMGTGGADQLAIARRMVIYHDEHLYDTIIMLGDNIYEDGSASDFARKFERPYAELLRRGVRFYAALGNHDVRRGRAAQMNYPLFNMAGRAYYTFTKADGLIEFFVLDSTQVDDAQLRWLDSVLAASVARWKIAYFHHPIYSSGKRHGSSLERRTLLEPLFVRHKVAAVFSGHDHFYERTRPQQGVQYFVSGAGGKLRRGNINRRTPFFVAGNDEVHSFMYVEVTAERLTFRAVDEAGNILDDGVLMYERPGARPTSPGRHDLSGLNLAERDHSHESTKAFARN